MSALAVQNIQKYYQEQHVLKDIVFEVSDNEVFGLMGLNGSGKTSLLKCILDFQDVTSGDIRIFDCAHQEKAARSRLVYLPEKFNPPEYMTGGEYLNWIVDGHQLGLQNEALQVKQGELLAKVDLDKVALKKPVKDFSKGMLQKLGIIACLLSDKDLLILDEPMSGLDPKARALFRDIVLELKQLGKTVFLCTHILADVERLCDKIGILHEGRLLFIGSPERCCEHYKAQTLEQAFLSAIDVGA